MTLFKHPFRSLILSSVLALTLSSCSYSGVGRENRIIERTEPAMGTIVTIKVSVAPGESEATARDAIGLAMAEIGRVESLFSAYREDSQVAKLNRARPNEAVKIDPEVFGLIKRSVGYSKDTYGAFDITVKPLVDLWKLAKASGILPSEKDIREAMVRVGSEKIVLDDKAKTVSFTVGGMSIDMSGVAKGYATDRAVKILRDNGVRNAIVDSGGDMYCLGKRNPTGQWVVGIQHPRDRGRILYKIEIENEGIDTSGDYEKYFMIGGKRYSHIIDPRTGFPIGDDVVSATVIAKDSETADAYATAFCVLGEAGMGIMDKKGLKGVTIRNNNGAISVEMSKGLKVRGDKIEK